MTECVVANRAICRLLARRVRDVAIHREITPPPGRSVAIQAGCGRPRALFQEVLQSAMSLVGVAVALRLTQDGMPSDDGSRGLTRRIRT